MGLVVCYHAHTYYRPSPFISRGATPFMEAEEPRVPKKDTPEERPNAPEPLDSRSFDAPLADKSAPERIDLMTRSGSNPTAEQFLLSTNFSLTGDRRDNLTFNNLGVGESLKARIGIEAAPTADASVSTKKEAQVKKDAQGRVTEVSLPEGQRRQFGYDDKGELNRVVQPSGDTYVRKDGKWQVEGKPSQPLDFQNPEVNDRGELRYTRRDGSTVRHDPSGDTWTRSKDGTDVVTNSRDQVTWVSHPNGDSRVFTYDQQGKLSSYTEKGKNFYVGADGNVTDQLGKPTGFKNPVVGKDGSLTLTDSNGKANTAFHQADGSIVKRTAEGRTTEVTYSDGSTRKFGYNDKGRLNSFTDRDGTKFELKESRDRFGNPVNDFVAANGETRRNLSVQADGTVRYENKDGKIHTDYTSGNSSTTTRTARELKEIAGQIYQSSSLFSDNATTRKAVEGLTAADRAALDDQYKQVTGKSLTESLQSQLWNPLKTDNTRSTLALLGEANLRQDILKTFGPNEVTQAGQLVDQFNQRAQQQGLSPEQSTAAFEKASKDLKTGEPRERLKALEKALTDAAPTPDSIAAKYGVKREEVTEPDGTKVQRFFAEGANGEKLPVLELKGDNAKEIEVKLREWQEAKIKEVEAKYGVQISRDGQKDSPRGQEVALRAPRINELLLLDQALKLSQPSTGPINGKPLLIQFADQPTGRGLAYVNQTPSGQERILFEPRAIERGSFAFKETAIHELAHVGENKVQARDKAAIDDWYKSLGYRQVTTEQGTKQWQLRDKQGNYWAQDPTDRFGDWTRVDEKGRPLKADGTLAKDKKDGHTRNNEVMRSEAAVKPISDYFSPPWEHGAEGLAHYRNGEEGQRRLYHESPELYRISKEFNQKELDLDPRYGTNPDGTSKFIRLPSGDIVQNNPANQKIVSDFEKSLQQGRAAAPGQPDRSQGHGHLPNFSCPGCR